ncbi:MAG: DUF3048 domain-containing protein [Chloroflexi bacterium]|nr:DUF3048 domain-containing protein [Chloroflexota bacterium]
MKRFRGFFQGILLVVITVGFSSCNTPQTPSTPTSPPLSASLSELEGTVKIKQPQDAGFSEAVAGMTLQIQGQVQTGIDGRARLDLSSGTIIRVAPSSLFTLEDNQQQDDGLATRLRLEAGKLWIILNGGLLEVETPSGLASVRGSYMSVELQSDGLVKVTCLDGHCHLGNDAGSVDLVAGEAAFVQNISQTPTDGKMSSEDIREWLDNNPEAALIVPDLPIPPPTFTPTPQPISTPAAYGPDQEDFPDNINPLTGLPVADPALLKQPALLVSIPHFPPTARPQAGLSFAPWVFEYLIGEGTTRFLAVFYGLFPSQEFPITGDCDVREEPFVQDGVILGNFIWLDKNENGIQDPGEPGVGGVCVNLYDADGQLVQQTTSDSNGYYGFNVEAGKTYKIEFVKPERLDFTLQNIGDENHDSDADPATGLTDLLTIAADNRLYDAGLIPPASATSDETASPGGQVGPVRSARLVHIHIQKLFQNSCLIFAGATDEIVDKIPACALVFGEGNGGAGGMLDVSRMVEISEKNAARTGSDFNYASNRFSEEPPSGGQPASQLDVFVSQLNQSRWVYDPLRQGWLRYVDNTSEETRFHVDTDRLTGRQLVFENVIVLFAEHEVIKPLIIDMYLQQGELENALLFRDGRMYNIKWSTRAGEYERTTGLRRPIAFQDLDGNPVSLRPGRTWILIATPYSVVSELSPERWKLRLYSPPGAGEY